MISQEKIPHKSISQLFTNIGEMQRVIKQAQKHACEEHALRDESLPVWRNGQIEWIQAREILNEFPDH